MQTCSVRDCEKPIWANGLCHGHCSRLYRRGIVADITRLSPNQIVPAGDRAEIILRDTLGNETARAIIDLRDIDTASRHKWYLTGSGYVMTRINRHQQLFLHRFLLDAPKDMVVDHINGNPLDNRRSNIRVCTRSQNQMNLRLRKTNPYEVSGIRRYSEKGGWNARITHHGISVNLGTFKSQDEAVAARKQAESLYFGEFSKSRR